MNISYKIILWYWNVEKLFIIGNFNRLSIEVKQTTVYHRDDQVRVYEAIEYNILKHFLYVFHTFFEINKLFTLSSSCK